jgi:Type II secretion system (T2SS), protein F
MAALLVGVAVLVWPPGCGAVNRRAARQASARKAGAGQASARRAGARRATGTRTEPLEVSATVVMDLVAAALVAGLPGPQAVAAAADACGPGVLSRLAQPLDAWRLGIPADQAWAAVDVEFAPLGRSLILAERTGASASVVLTAAASDARSARQRRALVAARRLGVQLVLPLGLTTLPAFVLWGVVPVVIGLAEQLLVAR